MTRREKKFEQAIDGLIVATRITKDAAELAPFPGIKGAVGTVLVILETIRATKTNRENCLLLARDASNLVETLQREIARAPTQINTSLDAVVRRFVSSLEAINQSLQELASRTMFRRFLLHGSDADVIAECRQQLDQSFRVFMAATQIQIREELQRQQERTQEGFRIQHLSRLQVASARWNETRTCLDGTRVVLLNQIRAWAQTSDPSVKPICWLADVAGSGKSTVANQMASEWKKSNQLGGCFFFSRNVAENNDLKRFCGTIASDLAEWYLDMKTLICDAIERSPSIASRPFQEQFETLIAGPLSKAERSFIIVIDALDECNIGDRALLLHALFSIGLRSSVPMKVFVTSRPEHDIYKSIIESGQLHVQFDLHGETNISDVRRYVRFQLSSLSTPNPLGLWPGPTAQEITAIAERAGGLFIWASTACKMVKDSVNPRRLVSRLANDGSLKELDNLYLEALLVATPSGDPTEREEVMLVLHTIVSDDQTVRMWDAISGTALGQPLTGHTAAVKTIAFSPDAAQIASGAYDNTVRIWNTADFELGDVLEGHKGYIHYITFSPDKARIASASHDGTIRIWDTASGSPISGPLEGLDSRAVSVDFFPDGNSIVAKSTFGTTYHWELHDSAWALVDPDLSLATTPLQATEYGVGSVEDKVELNRDGWVYQVGSRRRRLFYLPLVNRNNNNWGHDRDAVAAVSGSVLVVGSQHGHIMIIDCSPLLK